MLNVSHVKVEIKKKVCQNCFILSSCPHMLYTVYTWIVSQIESQLLKTHIPPIRLKYTYSLKFTVLVVHQ